LGEKPIGLVLIEIVRPETVSDSPMDTIDRFDSNVPARLPADSSRAPAPIPAQSRDLAIAPSPPAQVNPRVLLRGLSRHWWRILLLWLVVSTPLAYLIYELVEPTFQAVSVLRIEPDVLHLFNTGESRGGGGDMRGIQPYLLTQVEIIKSDTVLEDAITSPNVVNLPRIKNSEDPKTDLRDDMVVEIVSKGTYLIRVALESRIPSDAAAIVNAVVASYLKQHNEYHRSSNSVLRQSLDTELNKLAQQIEEKKAKVKELVGKGTFDVSAAKASQIKAVDEENAGVDSRLNYVTESAHAHATNQLLDTELKLLEADAELRVAERARDQSQTAEGQQEAELAGAALEERIRDEFYKDADVAAVQGEIDSTQENIKRIKGAARRGTDPAVVPLLTHLKTLEEKRNGLWQAKYALIKEKLMAEDPEEAEAAWEAKIAELKSQVDRLKLKQKSLAERIQKLKVESKNQNNDTLSYKLAEQDLSRLQNMQAQIKEKLEQLDFEIGQDKFRVSLHDRAREPKTPSNNKRLKYMAAAPVGILFLMLGLFLMLEIKAERVADPEALSSRVQSEVYALPPLPTSRSIRRRNLLDADDQIEQFIQRLDHLRFAVCGTPAELEKGRCVLITSAIGGEGKTTLGAQLAARCGNAGMSTLLIDADLRRTSLCSLLDVADGPGLSDALLHDEPPPTELVIPVQGGTFHLLPAGTPVQDTSRVLQDRKLGLLIGQFRQLYDLIIIDSPPVLPVPDALIIGRWVDGAVLAVRYDISRFPQVERARRQLDGAGIAVLGTVINGMRNSDSYYGRYSYSRRRSPQADTTEAI
jgi:capsular exopolysaccharide synthesis family protein